MCLFGTDLSLAASYLRQLADDLDLIASGAAPTEEDLAAAPVLNRWRPEMSARGHAAVGGIVSGDELYEDGEFVHIEIVAADPECTWIRSLLGWYRLGDEMQEVGHA